MSSAVLVVAGRELRERGRLFAVSVVFAIVPFLVAALPSAKSDRIGALTIVAAVLSLALGWGSALALGSSVIGRELSERRFSFHLARPISTAEIWIGKASAAMLTSLLCFVIIMGPALLIAPRFGRAFNVRTPEFLLISPIGIVVFFLVSHAMSTMVRSKLALIAVDFVLACVTVSAIWMMARSVLIGGGNEIAAILGITVATALILVLALAPLGQLARGRADIRRSHTSLSMFLWGGVGAVLLIAASYVTWLVSVEPSDIVEVLEIDQAPAGGDALMVGKGKLRGDYISSFVVSGGSKATRIMSLPWSGMTWSRDGRTGVYPELTSFFLRRPEFELRERRTGEEKSLETGIKVNGAADIVLSDDGARLAVLHNGILTVHDLRAKRMLGSTRGLEVRESRSMFFVNPNLVRIVSHPYAAVSEVSMSIFEFDLAARTLTRTGTLPRPAGTTSISSSSDGSRMYAGGTLIDGRSGETVAVIPSEGKRGYWHERMLNDGTVAVIRKGEAIRLLIFDRDGKPVREIVIGVFDNAWIIGEMEGGKLVLSGFRDAPARAGQRSILIVDLAAGRVERTVEGVRGPGPQWSVDPRLQRFSAAQTFLGVDAKGTLIVWDSRTGAVKPFAG